MVNNIELRVERFEFLDKNSKRASKTSETKKDRQETRKL